MSDIFNEVQQDLQEEKLRAFWKRYKNYIIGFVSLCLLSTLGYVVWQHYVDKRNIRQSDSFYLGIQTFRQGEIDKALKVFDDLSKESGQGFPKLARFKYAALNAFYATREGKISRQDPFFMEALNTYLALSKDSSLDKNYREMALLSWAYLSTSVEEYEKISAGLEPILKNKRSAWRSLAQELAAFLKDARGEREGASLLFKDLAQDETVPVALRIRAQRLMTKFYDLIDLSSYVKEFEEIGLKE